MYDNGKWGYLDAQGEVVIPFINDAIPAFDTVAPFRASEGYITVYQNGKYGMYNTAGELVLPVIYKGLSQVRDGKVFANIDGVWFLGQLTVNS